MWSVADPDLQIRGRGGHPDQRGRGERGRSKKKNLFRPFGPQFGLKIRGAGGPPGTSPGSAIGHCRREDLAFFPLRSFFPTTFVYICIENAVQIGGFYYMRLRVPREECEFKKSAAYHRFVHLY